MLTRIILLLILAPTLLVTSLGCMGEDHQGVVAGDTELEAFYEAIVTDVEDFNEQLTVDPAGAVSSATLEDLNGAISDQEDIFAAYKLQYGDRFEVTATLDRDEFYADEVVVFDSGNIKLGFDDVPIPVLGLTLQEAHQRIQERYTDVFQQPRIRVFNFQPSEDSYTANIIGMFNEPGQVKVRIGYRLADGIADAGGVKNSFGDFATERYDQNQSEVLPRIDWSRATLLRQVRYLPEGDGLSPEDENGAAGARLLRVDVDFSEFQNANADYNIPLLPGDVFNLPSFEPLNKKILVIGEVDRPGRYFYRSSYTLAEALAVAGWITDGEGNYGGVIVVRGAREADDQRQVLRASALGIAKGVARDIYLQDGDIVYVDTDTLEDINRAITRILPIFTLANAGIDTVENYWNANLD